jgi:hypothetical protein
MGKLRNSYKILVGKPEEKRPLGTPDPSGTVTLKWILRK